MLLGDTDAPSLLRQKDCLKNSNLLELHILCNLLKGTAGDMKRLLCLIYAVLMVIMLMTGCSYNNGNKNRSVSVAGTTKEDGQSQITANTNSIESVNASPDDTGIEIPKTYPKVIINRMGYRKNDDKQVIFTGEKYGDTFNIVRAEDEVVVYTGKIHKKTTDIISKTAIASGDFSDFDEEGIYYIETDIIGRSYRFIISEHNYETIFLEAINNMALPEMESDAEQVKNICFCMDMTINALNYNSELFEMANESIDDEQKDIIQQLLNMSHWLIQQQAADGSIYNDYAATAAFCGIMSTGRTFFGKYGSEIEKECQKAGNMALKWLEGKSESKYEAADFYVMSKLMKTDYKAEYQKNADHFLKGNCTSLFDKNSENIYFEFCGALAYLDAEKNNNRENCNKLMQALVDKAEKISTIAETDTMFGTGTRMYEECIYNIMIVGFVNYLTPNKEYTDIVKNNIVYVYGFNETGIYYLDSKQFWSNNDDAGQINAQWYGILLFGLSDLLRNVNNS